MATQTYTLTKYLSGIPVTAWYDLITWHSGKQEAFLTHYRVGNGRKTPVSRKALREATATHYRFICDMPGEFFQEYQKSYQVEVIK